MWSCQQFWIRFGIGWKDSQGKKGILVLTAKIVQDFAKASNAIVCNKLDKKIVKLVCVQSLFNLIASHYEKFWAFSKVQGTSSSKT
jgi:hypothetical protein